MSKFRKGDETRHINDLEHIDELHRMKLRLFALEVAVNGAQSWEHGDERDAISQLLSDIVANIGTCVERFEATQKQRRNERRSAQSTHLSIVSQNS
jgi:hypothetical protein